MLPPEPPRALLITGTVGSGKISTADALGDLLIDAGVSNAVIDLDWLCRSWPSPPGDPFDFTMTLPETEYASDHAGPARRAAPDQALTDRQDLARAHLTSAPSGCCSRETS